MSSPRRVGPRFGPINEDDLRRSRRQELDRAMVVAVVLMVVMEVTFVDDVDVVAVGYRRVMVPVVLVVGVSNVAWVWMPTMMRARARVVGRASLRIPRAHRKSVRFDAITQLMLQPPFAEVVDVPLVSNGRMAASRSMSMRSIAVVLGSILHVAHLHSWVQQESFPGRACCTFGAIQQACLQQCQDKP